MAFTGANTLEQMRDIRNSLVNKNVSLTPSTPYAQWPSFIDAIPEASVDSLSETNEIYSEILITDTPELYPVVLQNYNDFDGPGYSVKHEINIPKDIVNGPQAGCAFSNDGTLFAFTSKYSETHGVFIFTRSNSSYSLFQQIPSSVFGATTHAYGSLRFSIDKKFLVVSSTAGVVLLRADDTTGLYAKFGNLLHPSFASYIRFSPDGNHLALKTNSTPYVVMYNISGDTFTAQSFSAPTSSTATCFEFSHDSEYLYISTPAQRIYKRSSGLYTLYLSPSGNANSAAWMKKRIGLESDYLVISAQTSPYLRVYSIVGGVFTLIANFIPNNYLSTRTVPYYGPLLYGGTRSSLGVDVYVLYVYGDYLTQNSRNPQMLLFDSNGPIDKFPIIGGSYSVIKDITISSDLEYIAMSLDTNSTYKTDIPLIYHMSRRLEIKESTNNLSDVYGCDAFGYLETRYDDSPPDIYGDMVSIYSKE